MKNFINPFLTCICVLIFSFNTYAQNAHFPEYGNIVYEKTVFTKNILRKQISYMSDNDVFMKPYYENMYRTTAETAIYPASLSFRNQETYFEFKEKAQTSDVKNLESMLYIHTLQSVYQNFETNKSVSEVNHRFLEGIIEDELIEVKWKITDEYRNIAGFDCRRANGVMLDSIYVVAFYTDQIPLSGGPAQFHGLPGMILGVAVPDLNYTIYATQVTISPATIKSELGTRRTTRQTRELLFKSMESTLRNLDPTNRLEFIGRTFL